MTDDLEQWLRDADASACPPPPLTDGLADRVRRLAGRRRPKVRITGAAAMLIVALSATAWELGHSPVGKAPGTSPPPPPATAAGDPASSGPLEEGAFWFGGQFRARSESFPPLRLSDLLEAECVVVGHFTLEKGKAAFVVERVLKGEAAAAQKQAGALTVKPEPDGRLTIEGASRGWDGGMNAFGASDARKTAIWFFGVRRAVGDVTRQGAELADGFVSLLAGRKPEPLFDLLQRLDFDRRWAALEELFAQRPPDLIAKLHDIALRADSDAHFDAAADLVQTRLLDPAKCWGKWCDLPWAYVLRNALMRRDPARTMEDLRKALAAKNTTHRLVALLDLIPYDAPDKLDLTLPYLDHPNATVRGIVVCRIWDVFWNLNDQAAHSPEARAKLETLGRRVVPLLEQRSKVETDPSSRLRLTQMLARQDGVPWLLRIPRDQIHEPIPPYSEAEEEKFLVNCLTSLGGRSPGDFIRVSAGREIAEHFFEDGFADLKKAAGSTGIFNLSIVSEGMGYVRDERVFDYLVEHARAVGVGDGTFQTTVLAIGLQNRKRSLAVLKELVAAKAAGRSSLENFATGLVDGLGALSDRDALPYLKDLEPRIEYHAKVPYLRARAMQGDKWAVSELLGGVTRPPTSKFLGKDFWARDDVVRALCFVETEESTAAIKAYVEESWPAVSDSEGGRPEAYLENYAGAARRTEPLGEISRRDPRWLAALALQKMGSPSWAARCFGLDVFRQLTGQVGTYRAEAFAAERAEALKGLRAWWADHRHQSREQWLVLYFREKGYEVQRLDKTSLPVLARALEADFRTHNLAVEQISAICRKYFIDFRHYESYQGQERMNTRVLGWLRARGLLPAGP